MTTTEIDELVERYPGSLSNSDLPSILLATPSPAVSSSDKRLLRAVLMAMVLTGIFTWALRYRKGGPKIPADPLVFMAIAVTLGMMIQK